MRRFMTRLLVLSVLFIMFGCTRHIVSLPVVMNSADEVPEGYVKVQDKAVGKHVQHMIIFFPIGQFPNIGKAFGNVFQGDSDKLMRNVTVNHKHFFVPPFYFRQWYEVTGEVWQRKETLGAGGTEGR